MSGNPFCIHDLDFSDPAAVEFAFNYLLDHVLGDSDYVAKTVDPTFHTDITVEGDVVNQDGQVATLPAGVVAFTIADSEPGGWLFCNGQAVNRATYEALNALAALDSYAAPWGSGNGTTTFNVPDIRDKYIIPAGTSYPRFTDAGSATHAHADHAAADLLHAHGITSSGGSFELDAGDESDPVIQNINANTDTGGPGALSHANADNMGPYIALHAIIKT